MDPAIPIPAAISRVSGTTPKLGWGTAITGVTGPVTIGIIAGNDQRKLNTPAS